MKQQRKKQPGESVCIGLKGTFFDQNNNSGCMRFRCLHNFGFNSWIAIASNVLSRRLRNSLVWNPGVDRIHVKAVDGDHCQPNAAIKMDFRLSDLLLGALRRGSLQITILTGVSVCLRAAVMSRTSQVIEILPPRCQLSIEHLLVMRVCQD